MRFMLIDGERVKNCLNHISQLPLGGEWAVEIYKPKERRSLNQNNLWHKWVDIIAKECGYHSEDMKIAIKRKCLGMQEIVNPLTGEVTYKDYSSAKLDKQQFTDLMTETQVIAADLGIVLPTLEDRLV